MTSCTSTDGLRLESLVYGTIHVAKAKALISFAVTAKLICAFVFANAECWLSHDAAQISKNQTKRFHFLLCIA